MKYLVTGAGGFMGRTVVEELLSTETAEVTAVLSPTSPRIASHPNLRLVRADLTEEITFDAEADAIFHLASKSHVPNAIKDPVGIVGNNVQLQLNVLELARRIEPKIFVQMSTEGVYGTSYDPVKEWDTILPSNPYAASKAAQEAIAISYWRTYNVPLSIINVVNVFGPKQGAEKFIPIIVRKLKAGETIQIHGNEQPDGSWVIGERAYEYIKNVFDAMLFLAERDVPLYPDAPRPDRWHIGGRRVLSNDEMVRAIGQALGIEPKLEFVAAGVDQPGYDPSYNLNGKKIEEAGWIAPYTFEEAIRETVDG